MAARPRAVTIRAYQVGFGDCFLLTFHYPQAKDRHVLIDFGSTGAPRGFGDLSAVANSIKEECGGKLHAVVATHRHRDHISGFATDGDGPGGIIASCEPDVVVQPWTEDPEARPDAKAATALSTRSKGFVAALQDMHAVAQAVLDEAPRLESLLDNADLDEEEAEPEADEEAPAERPAGPRKRQRSLFKYLAFMGENNLPNRSAVDNLQRMGKRRFYVHTGSRSGLEPLLPGVKVTVLGPPTLEQTETIRAQMQRDESEFWQFQAQASQLAADPATERLFPDAPVLEKHQWPKWSRWLIPRLRGIRGEQLREIVRVLDNAMNNTSVILLFEVGKHKLLFPGDAQIENWLYALSQKRYQKLLRDVTFYKVGHHGSMNATPKSLWNGFARRSRGLHTMVSTMKGKHGNKRRSTEVPRATLVKALTAESRFFTTESIHVRDGLFHCERIEL
jgi:hypothetical protein